MIDPSEVIPMVDRSPIQYKGFWDVPRIFLTSYAGQTFLFECGFDQELDDYPDCYKVFLLPKQAERELPQDWMTLSARATQFLGEVPVARVEFDSTRRQSIATVILDDLLTRKSVAG